MKKRILISIMLSVSMTILSGCWDRVEINDIAIVAASGFDLAEDGLFRVSTQIPLPGQMGGAGSGGGGGGTGGDKSFYVDSETGRNLSEAYEKMQMRMSRRLFFAHERVLVIGEDFARKGISSIMDVIARYPESRLTTYLLVARGDALDILNSQPHLESVPAEAMREIAKSGINIRMKDFIYAFERQGSDPILPVVETITTDNHNPGEQKKELQIHHVALFKENRLSMITDAKQTMGVFWLTERMKGKSTTFPLEDETEIGVRIDSSKMNLKHTVKNGKPVFNISVEATGFILEDSTFLNLENPDIIHRIEKNLESTIQSQIESVLEASLKRGLDSFGLGLHLFRTDNHLWEQWKDKWSELLTDLHTNIQVKFLIDQSGFTSKGFGKRE